jgi:hypothetical protein
MPLAKCVRCEKLFSKTISPVCPSCLPEEEKDQEKIRTCLNENPNISAEMVSEKTGVSVQCVMRMIDVGMVVSGVDIKLLKCGKCGAPAISASKRLCQACLDEMNRNVAKQRIQMQQQARKHSGTDDNSSVRESLGNKRGD